MNQTNGYGQVSFHGQFYTSYKPRSAPLTFIIDIISQKNELLVFSLKNAFFQTEKKCVIFFPSIDLREVLLQ